MLAGYVALWIVEGAFRKWVPGTSLAFYVLRDGYAVAALVWLASSRTVTARRLPWWIYGVLLVAGVWLALQFVFTSAPSPVILIFGLRSYLAPLLFAVLCYKYGAASSLRRVCAVIAVAAPVELALTVLQVTASPTATINVEVGGAPNDFVNNGVVRATGTFAAPLGLTVYLLLALCVGLWWTTERTGRAAGWAVVVCTLAVVGLSGARGAVLNSVILLAFYVVQSLARPSVGSIGRVVGLLVVLALALVAIQLALPDVLQSFVLRFNQASAAENSSDRVVYSFSQYLSETPTLFGAGMGTESNAGIALGSSSGWVENDSLRWVGELGILGWLMSLMRTIVVISLAAWAIVRLRRSAAAAGLFRAGLVVLLGLGSINDTPTSEGVFAILLGAVLLSARAGTADTALTTTPVLENHR